jgi:hypothetical protein
LCRGSSKTEEAAELYVKAGNAFKMAKKWAGKFTNLVCLGYCQNFLEYELIVLILLYGNDLYTHQCKVKDFVRIQKYGVICLQGSKKTVEAAA